MSTRWRWPRRSPIRAGCSPQNQWPFIDVTRRSIEETAAAIIDLHKVHRMKFIAQA